MNRWLLGLVIVLSANINVHVFENGTAESVLGKHTANGILHQPFGHSVPHFTCSPAELTARVTGVPDVFFILPLVASQLHLFGVDDHHIVAAIGMGGEVHLVFSSQQSCDFCTQAAQTLPFGIDDHPLLVCVLLIDGDGFVAQGIHCTLG